MSRQCTHTLHFGYATNQPGVYDPAGPHALRVTCDRPACREAAMNWVVRKTNMPATYVIYARS